MRTSLLVGRGGFVLPVIAFALISTWAAKPVLAQDCSPLQPSRPVDTEVANKTKPNANVLLKSLGSGEIDNEYSNTQNDVLSKYPNADKVHIWDGFVYMMCTLLQSSRTLTDGQKLDRYQALVEKSQAGQPQSSPQTSGGTESVTQTSSGALMPPIPGNSGTITIQSGSAPPHRGAL